MADTISNEAILEGLRNGTAKFELDFSPLNSISAAASCWKKNFIGDNGSRFFARIGPSLGGQSPAMKKVERFSVRKVFGDERCLFRALVKGMAYNKGTALGPGEERNNADELRWAINKALCGNKAKPELYQDAIISITVDVSLNRYCQRIVRPDVSGGEPELLVLSKLCKQPIIVYIPEHERRWSIWGSGFIPIAEYGTEISEKSITSEKKKVVRLLYSGNNHYDLLV